MKKDRKIKTILTAAVVVAIAAAGLLLAGAHLGWLDRAERGETAVVSQVSGIAELERDGLVSALSADTVLRTGDGLTTFSDAQVDIASGESSLVLDEDTEVSIQDTDALAVELTAGQIFVCADADAPVTLCFDGETLSLEDAVVALSVEEDSQTLYLLSGSTVLGGETYDAGQILVWTEGAIAVSALSADLLDDFCLAQALAAWDGWSLCCPLEDLEQEVADRQAARQAEIEASANAEETGDAAGSEKAEESAETAADEPEDEEDTASKAGIETDTSDTAEKSTDTDDTSDGSSGTATEKTDPTDSADTGTDTARSDASDADSDSSADTTVTASTYTCTISIRCDTILDHMDALDAAKAAYVPASGVLLSTTTITFTQGESVYDVLKRACSAAGLALEASWSPAYGSYYVEGIGHLYEFDCGSESGWIYKVNGKTPSYGCSSYTVSQGDSIVFYYTCSGQGADVG